MRRPPTILPTAATSAFVPQRQKARIAVPVTCVPYISYSQKPIAVACNACKLSEHHRPNLTNQPPRPEADLENHSEAW